MMRLGGQALDLLLACAERSLADMRVSWAEDHALTVVYAANGYPGAYEKGSEISGLNDLQQDSGHMTFHAGTALVGGNVTASGGRVLAVTARADSLQSAQSQAYDMIATITWPEGFYRNDIGWRAL
jgi:phosphoribosylamine--glycine ligase